MIYKIKISNIIEVDAQSEAEAIEGSKKKVEALLNLDLLNYYVENPLQVTKKNKIVYESNDSMVSHPKHYQSKSGLEVIDVIKAFTDGLTGIEAYEVANIIKYICRYKDKNGVQDIEKLIWYAMDLIKNIKEKKDEK